MGRLALNRERVGEGILPYIFPLIPLLFQK